MKTKHKLLFYILILLLQLTDCKSQLNPDYFHTYIQSDPGRLDPFYSTDVTSGRILAKFCDTLFNINNQGILEKNLLKAYSFNQNNLFCTLKKNIYFSNGDHLTANDVKFSFLRIRDSKNPTSPRRWLFSNIKNINIINKFKFKIELRKISATFLYLLTMPAAYIISEKAYRSQKKIIGSGPFFIKEWKNDQSILLLKNNNYHSKQSEIKGIVYKIIPEDLTARFEFLNNTLDYFEIPYLSASKFDQNNYKIINAPEFSTHYIALNNSRAPFNNKEFRQALNMAVDRKKIMQILFKNRFTLAAGPIPEGMGNYKTRVTPYSYNPKKALKIIKRLNLYKKHFNLNIKADQQVSLMAQLIQYYLEKCGLKISIQEMEWAALKATTINRKYDMALFTWHADYPEAENFLIPLFHSGNMGQGGNRAFYSNKKVDFLMNQAATVISERKRFDIYYRIEEIIVDDAPWIFLWYGDKKIALNPRLDKFLSYPTYNGMKGNYIKFK